MNQFAQSDYTLKPVTEQGMKRKLALQKDIFEHLIPQLPDSSKVLEIGPGRGEFAQECQLRKLAYVGIEPSDELSQDFSHSGICIIKHKVPPIPAKDEEFNLVHSYDFIEHLGNYVDVMEFFSESYRVLKPGGYVSAIAPNYETIRHLFYQYDYQHSYIVTKHRMRNMLLDCGFEIVIARCYLLWLSPKLRIVDRILAHTAIPLSINSLTQGMVRLFTSEDFLYRVLKNMYDHVAILARKPL